MNDSKPQILLRRCDNNDNLSINTVPQIVTSTNEKCREVSVSLGDTSENKVKCVSFTNMQLCLDKNEFDNNGRNINKSQKDLCITKSLYNSQHIIDKEQSLCRFEDDFTTIKITPLKSLQTDNSNEYASDSLNSLSPIIDDILKKDISENIQDLNISLDELYSSSFLEENNNNNKSHNPSQIDSTSHQKKIHILSNIKLVKPLNIVKSGTSFVVRKSKMNKNVSDNNSDIYNNTCLPKNTESLLNENVTSIQNISINSKLMVNIENISSSSKFDPTYEPSLSNTLESSSINKNNEISVHDISACNKTENIADVLPQDKSSFSLNLETSVQPGACNDSTMFVASSQGWSGANKQNFCFYCKTFQTKIHRHLERIHKNEADVQKFINLPKNTKERRQIIDTIRRNGNFLFNTNTKYNNGELIVCRRPNKKKPRTAQNFQACINCKGFFSKATLRHHVRYCFGRSKKRERSIMILGRAITGRIHKAANPMLAKVVFPVLRDDHIIRLIRYHELIIKHANKLCDKYKLQHQHEMIRSRLRLLGRFLYVLKAINPNVDDFASLYHPKYYDNIIQAVNKVAKFNSRKNVYKTPSNATNLGTLLKQVGNTLITECIKKSDNLKKQVTEDLLKLLKNDFSASISRTALETQSQKKRQKKVVLPTTTDISKLYNYLKKIRQSNYGKLIIRFSYNAWLNLAKATLVTILVFNRRRAGETERILVKEFNSRQAIDEKTNFELFESLSSSNKKIAKKYVRFVIRGKKNRDVPVLLNSDLTQNILLLLEHRRNAKIHHENPYLFALPGKNKNRFKFLRACQLLREFSEQCGADLPTSLRGTKLRKHIATKCILLNLQNDEVTDLCNYMGHAENIHKEYYRQPIISRDILRMSQLLEKAQNVADEDGEYKSNSDVTESSDDSDTENIPCNAQSFNKNDTVKSIDLYDISEPINASGESSSSNTVKKKRSSKLIKNVFLLR